jgi:SWI/SNF-related matrix-associated actin-dependent regulator 1 of chromatin subfamily A
MKNLPPIRFDTLPLTSEAAVRAIKHIDKSGEIEKVEAALREGPEALAKIAPHVATLRRVTGLAKAPLVAEWVKDWLEAGGSKIVIFAHHRDVIKHLQDALEDVAVVLTGDMGVWPRQAAVDAFQTDPVAKVFIGQIQAAGTGITLTAASDVLFAESSWVPAENSQAAMRVHRIGQKNACLVRFATLAGSIDERIQAVVSRKMFDIAQLFG